jgi:hypothetical protein
MLTSTPDLTTDSAIAELGPERELLAARTANLKIRDATGYSAAAEWLKSIKGFLQRIEAARTRITKPLNEALREINGQAKATAAPFLESEQRIKSAMIAYSNEQDRMRREEQRKLDEKAESDRRRLLEAASQVIAPVAQVAAPKIAGISIPEVWDFEITDEDLVPREYCEVSTKRIRSQVMATKGLTQIAGVRVFKTKRISAGVA